MSSGTGTIGATQGVGSSQQSGQSKAPKSPPSLSDIVKHVKQENPGMSDQDVQKKAQEILKNISSHKPPSGDQTQAASNNKNGSGSVFTDQGSGSASKTSIFTK